MVMPGKSLEPPASPFIPYGFQFPRRRHAIPVLDVRVSGRPGVSQSRVAAWLLMFPVMSE